METDDPCPLFGMRIAYKFGSVWAAANVEQTATGLTVPVDRRAVRLSCIEVNGDGDVVLMSPQSTLIPFMGQWRTSGVPIMGRYLWPM